MELAVFSINTELANKLVSEIAAAGHSARLLDLTADWSVELGERTVSAVLLDLAADAARVASISKAMRQSSGAGKLRQIAVLDAGRLGTIPVPVSVDELAVYPFRPGELAAKLKLIADGALIPTGTTLVFGNILIDTAAYEVRRDGVPVALTFKEQELLHYLASSPDRVFSRSQLLTEVWGYDYYGGTRTVDVHVRRLRLKLGPEMEARIQTVRNVGYKFASKN